MTEKPARAINPLGGGPEDEEAYGHAYQRALLGQEPYPDWDDFGLASDIAEEIRKDIEHRARQEP